MLDPNKVTSLDFAVVGRRRRRARPEQVRGRVNWVARALERTPGKGPALARLCGVSKTAVYDWVKAWRIDRLEDALKVSRATGISLEKLAGTNIDFSEADKIRVEVDKEWEGALDRLPARKP